MKFTFKVILLIVCIVFTSCSSKDSTPSTSEETKVIAVGNYEFEFPTDFDLVELEGIDSYVGNLVGNEITLSFDFGWYTSPLSNLSEDEFIVTDDVINGHFRQIVQPINPETQFSRIHLYRISDSIASPYGYNSLTMYTQEISASQLETVLTIFNSAILTE